MIIRPQYMNTLKTYRDVPLVKILAGIRLYGDNIVEKCGKGRDGAGDHGKTRYLCGKTEHFRRERLAVSQIS